MSRKRPSHRQLAAEQLRRLPPSATDGWRESVGGAAPRSRHQPGELQRVELPADIDLTPIAQPVADRIADSWERIQAFQDRWDQPQIEQFVASDYQLVYRVLRHLVEQEPLSGGRMLEWGCGFAVVAALAASLGLDVAGIEAERRLLDEAALTAQQFGVPIELVWGNFLPPGAERLCHNPDFPSLGHRVPCGYQRLAADLDDFAIVFGYPWPGEWQFHEAVFAHYGGSGGLLVLFCGPNDVRVWRKTSRRRVTARHAY